MRTITLATALIILAFVSNALVRGPNAQMMGGGMMNQNRMREMMQRMMSDRLPPKIEPENLPGLGSEGAKLLIHYCNECHNLPNPSMHSAEEWPVVANRMFRRISMMSGMGGMGMCTINVENPSPEEQKTIIAYLKAHSLKSISASALSSPESQEATFFRNLCSQCHSLPDPKLHTAKEWPSIVKKMRAYMQSMDKKVVTEHEEKGIVSYLMNHARE